MLDNNDTHSVGMTNIFTSFRHARECENREVKSNPVNCLFKHNDQLTGEVESALHSQVLMYAAVR